MHRIRLRKPWELTTGDSQIRLSRTFNCPTNLVPEQKVWVGVRTALPLRSVRLNDITLPALESQSRACSGENWFDASDCLKSFNQLDVLGDATLWLDDDDLDEFLIVELLIHDS
ncbi:MAG: hypothetical protein KDB03_18595 [Planctomycetales bacterium]|nr:hypothetical protein [Planctomycetales bacterium]